MQVKFIDNMNVSMQSTLSSVLINAEVANFAIAFVKYSGLQLVEPALDECLDKGGQVEFLVGLDFRTTDAKSLHVLKTKSEQYNCELYCYSDPVDNTETYHPKLYYFRENNKAKAIIGSSNLTKGGLVKNIEINSLFEFDSMDVQSQIVLDIYTQMKFQPKRFSPDSQYIDAYEEASKRALKVNSKVYKDKKLLTLLDGLREKEETLPSPFSSSDHLVGWQKLVYDKIPEIEFNTSDMYVFAEEFQEIYPENQYVSEKIRQVLQQLRDIGLLIHLANGRWKKREFN